MDKNPAKWGNFKPFLRHSCVKLRLFYLFLLCQNFFVHPGPSRDYEGQNDGQVTGPEQIIKNAAGHTARYLKAKLAGEQKKRNKLRILHDQK